MEQFNIDKTLPSGLQFDTSTGLISGKFVDTSFETSEYLVSAQKGVLIARGGIVLKKASATGNSLVIILSATGGGLLVLSVIAYVLYRKYKGKGVS
jgi:ABC-type glycerol-3-phosphate transport system permease component